MRQAAIGRVLVASLHQGIADLLPTRLSFYENWLNVEGLRGGTIGLAPLQATLSFLRQEGVAYELITTRAGEYAAEWTVDSMPAASRALVRSAPPWLRRRLLVRLFRALVRRCYDGTRTVARVRGRTARFDLSASLFCSVREPVERPLCGFYAAAFARLLARFDLPAHVDVIACRGTGDLACVLTVAPAGRLPVPSAGVEAA